MVKHKKNQPWTVWRITPDKQLKSIRYTNHKEAINYTAMSLVDNGYATKREAQEWAASVPTTGLCRYGEHRFEFIPASAEDQEPVLGYILAQINLKPKD